MRRDRARTYGRAAAGVLVTWVLIVGALTGVGKLIMITGNGNGPIAAYVDALGKNCGIRMKVRDYHQHATGAGSDAQAVSFIEAETGEGRVKPLRGEFEGFLRLRAGSHRVFFKETADTITVHRIRDRKDAYR